MSHEAEGGYIRKECPECGQYCKAPEQYYYSHKTGAYANSYCKRCKKKVKLLVEFV